VLAHGHGFVGDMVELEHEKVVLPAVRAWVVYQVLTEEAVTPRLDFGGTRSPFAHVLSMPLAGALPTLRLQSVTRSTPLVEPIERKEPPALGASLLP
jgi:hypothetical protein